MSEPKDLCISAQGDSPMTAPRSSITDHRPESFGNLAAARLLGLVGLHVEVCNQLIRNQPQCHHPRDLLNDNHGPGNPRPQRPRGNNLQGLPAFGLDLQLVGHELRPQIPAEAALSILELDDPIKRRPLRYRGALESELFVRGALTHDFDWL